MVSSIDVHFGIRVGPLRSRTWRVRSGARRPELFVEREGLERAAHVSLHESGQWHMKVGDAKVWQWDRPKPLRPGFTRALVIVQPPALAWRDDPPPAGARLFNIAAADERAAQFSVFIEDAGAPLVTWPGARAMGTEFVARLPMTDGSTACVVLHREVLPAEKRQIPYLDDAERERLLDVFRQPNPMMTLFGRTDDGAFQLIDLRFDAGERTSA